MPYVPHSNYLEFRNAVNGNGYDMDGYYGYQCWDGVDLLYQQSDVGQYLYTAFNFDTSLSSGVRTCWTYAPARARNGSGHFSEVLNVTDIRQGDIIVLDQYPGWYASTGHIGFADEDYNGTDYIYILGQNQGAGDPQVGAPFNIMRSYIGVGAFLGAFRYDAWASTPPIPPIPENRGHFPWVLYAKKFRNGRI